MESRYKKEKRHHERFVVNCEMALRINSEFYPCTLVNLSRGGVLANIIGTATATVSPDDIGTCFLDYRDESFESQCRVVRVLGENIGLMFINLGIKEILFLNKLIAECAK